MNGLLYFENLQIGDRWVSPARTVTETDVVLFAGLTGDYDPLHVDHQFALQTPYRRPIAHGLLGLSWLAGLSSNHPRVSTLAFISIVKWEFRLPLFIGDTVHAITQVVEKQPHGRRCGQVTWYRELVNQDAAIVQMGTFETLVALEQAVRRRAESVPPPHSRRSAKADAPEID